MTHSVRIVRWLLLMLILFIISIQISPPQIAIAATYTVSKIADTNDGVCNADCSLREAITAANANSGVDTITFNAAIFVPATITLTSALPQITDNVDIVGLGANKVIVNGANAFRPINIAASKTVTLSGITITQGSGDKGGGIANRGTLTLRQVALTQNTATVGGGALYQYSGGVAYIYYSTFSGNTGVGAAINNLEGGSGLIAVNSTFANNHATGNGGVLASNSANVSPIEIFSNCTLSGNTATGSGGAIYAQNNPVAIAFSIIAGNTAPTGPDIAGKVSSSKNNIIGNSSGATISTAPAVLASASDLIGAAASPLNLGALANNGGSTQTMALAAGSVAIDRGDAIWSDPVSSPLISITDQRSTGFPRFVNGNRDIGAFEYAATSCPTFPYTVPASNVARLRFAMACANSNGTGTNDTIQLTHSIYTLTDADNDILGFNGISFAVSPVNGLPVIESATTSGTLSIQGNGATVQRATDAPETFRFLQVASAGNGTFNNITLLNGYSGGTSGAIFNAGTLSATLMTISNSTTIYGGAVENTGTLTLTNSTLSNNTSTGSQGRASALYNRGWATLLNVTISGNSTSTGTTVFNETQQGGAQSTLTVNGGTFVNNVAAGGAGITNSGILVVTATTFDTNSATLGGGALYNAGTATIRESLFFRNSVTSTNGYGGAILNVMGAITISNSTFTENTSAYGAGAIAGGIGGNGSSINLINVTISGNSANLAGGAGGIFSGGNLRLVNTILANNTNGDCITNSSVIAQRALIENTGANACGIANGGANANIIGQDPQLGVLADNGGSTRTLLLLSGSPARNVGGNSFLSEATLDLDLNGDGDKTDTLTTDQRGTGFARIRNTTVDIGAFESGLGSATVTLALQERTNPAPHFSRIVTGHVLVTSTNGATTYISQDFTTDGSSVFSVAGLLPGTYRFTVKGDHTLARQFNHTIVDPNSSVTTAVLLEGDADDNNLINVSDFSILATAFGKSQGQIGFNASADFNNDTIVNILDFSMLAVNFNQIGDGGLTP